MCEHRSPALGPAEQPDRRDFLRTTGRATVLAAGLGTVAAPMLFEPAAAGRSRTRAYSGRFTGVGTPDWHYVPVRVPRGVREIEVSYDYEPTPTPIGVSANVIDIGLFDASGHSLGNAAGFRGWSGGARRSFRVSRSAATPGYLPGPVKPGLWHVILGPVGIVPPGVEWTLTVTLHFGRPSPRFRPSPAPRSVPGTRRRWYRGDLHLHTVHSDGSRTPAQLVEAASASGLDFFASTEHNTSSASLVWGRHTPAGMLVLNGEEVTTREGHWLAVGLPAGAWVDWRYRSTDGALPRFVDQVRGLGGMAIIAHPTVPIPATGWSQGPLEQADAIEVWNGPWTLDDEGTLSRWHAMLVAGRYVPVVGSSDSHRPDQPVGLPQTVVLADTLSAGALVRALKAGRAWLAESADVHLDLTVSGPAGEATCGGRITTGAGDDVTVRLDVHGVPGCVATLIGATGPLATATADEDGRVALERALPAASARFLRAEVRRPGSIQDPPTDPMKDAVGSAMVALTNPVFVDLG